MLNELINKQVEIKVAFSNPKSYAGSLPKKYEGKLLEVDENLIKVEIISRREKNKTIINLDYVISIKEIKLWKRRCFYYSSIFIYSFNIFNIRYYISIFKDDKEKRSRSNRLTIHWKTNIITT